MNIITRYPSSLKETILRENVLSIRTLIDVQSTSRYHYELRWRPIGSGICTCTKRDDRRVRLIRNKSIRRPVDCRPNDSTAIQLTVSSWLSNNARSFDEDESRRLTYTTLHKTKRDYTRSLSTSGTGYLPFTFDRWTQRIFWRGVLSRCMKLRDLKISN